MLPFAGDIDTPGNEFKVDYSKSVNETYGALALWHLNQYHTLDFLRNCKPASERSFQSLPSWIPDWRDCQRSGSTLYVQNDGEFRIPLFRTNFPMASFQQPLQAVKMAQALTLSGLRIAKIDAVPLDQLIKSSTTQMNPLCGMSQAEVLSRSLCWDTVLDSGKDNTSYTRGAFVRIANSAVEYHAEWSAKLVEENKDDFEDQQGFFTLSGTNEADVLGVVRAYARSGDELWMLKGGNVLYILRPWDLKEDVPIYHLDTTAKTSALHHTALTLRKGTVVYDFICEAFVLGLMDGELLNMVQDPPTKPRPTCLEHMDRTFRTIHLTDQTSILASRSEVEMTNPRQVQSRSFPDVTQTLDPVLHRQVDEHQATNRAGQYRYVWKVNSAIERSSMLQD